MAWVKLRSSEKQFVRAGLEPVTVEAHLHVHGPTSGVAALTGLDQISRLA